MDKQKQIQEMAKDLGNATCRGRSCAECEFDMPRIENCVDIFSATKLVNAGYGNLKEFVNWLKTKSFIGFLDVSKLDELLKEYGYEPK